MKSVETIRALAQGYKVDLMGLSPALNELCAQDEFAALRETLKIYSAVLKARAV